MTGKDSENWNNYYLGAWLSARNWFLRGPNPSNANNVRNVNTDGSLNNNNANNANGFVADCAGIRRKAGRDQVSAKATESKALTDPGSRAPVPFGAE